MQFVRSDDLYLTGTFNPSIKIDLYFGVCHCSTDLIWHGYLPYVNTDNYNMINNVLKFISDSYSYSHINNGVMVR